MVNLSLYFVISCYLHDKERVPFQCIHSENFCEMKLLSITRTSWKENAAREDGVVTVVALVASNERVCEVNNKASHTSENS